MIENRRVTSPFLIPDFAMEYIFLHNAIQIFFQDDSRDIGKKNCFLTVLASVTLCPIAGFQGSAFWTECLPALRRCGQEPRQLVKQHSNGDNKSNSSGWLGQPRREGESEMQPVYTGRGGHMFALLLLMSRICTAPWQLCPASAGQFQNNQKRTFLGLQQHTGI